MRAFLVQCGDELALTGGSMTASIRITDLLDQPVDQ
jgi:hypothetical protein